MDDLKEAQDAKIQAFESVVKYLPAKDREFAQSLIRQYKAKGGLSDRQWFWVDKLITAATGAEVPAAKAQVGDFSGVVKLFKTAKQHVKYPKIVLQVGEQPIALSMAGENSKYKGEINVTDGRPFGQNIWFGRVNAEGGWTKGQNANDMELAAVESFLKKFGQDPAGTAKEYGKLTGRCCFCNSGLTDERSTAAGFGPTCAKHFGLEAEWKAATAVFDTQKKLELA